MLRIIIQEKGGNRQEIQTDKAEFTIGRVPINDLALPKNNVSKRHAKIARTDSGWELIDLGSTNGTFVNGDQVKQHRITPTDQVIIGDFLLQFEMLDGSQPPPVPGGPSAPPPMGGPGAPPPMGGPGGPPSMGGPGAPPPMGGPGAPPSIPPGPPGMGGPGGPGAPPPMGGPGAPPPMGGPGGPPRMGGPGGPPSMGGPGAPPPMGGPGNMPPVPPGPPSMGGMLPMSGPNTPPPKPPGPPGMGGPGGPPPMGGPGAPPPMGGPGAPPRMGGPGTPPPMSGPGAPPSIPPGPPGMGGPGGPPPMGGPGAMPPIPPGPPSSGGMEEPALANEPSSPDMPPMPPGLQGDNVDSSSGDENAEALGLDDPSLLEVPDLPDDPDGDDGTPTPPEGLPASMEVPPDDIDQDEPAAEESPSEALPEELPVEEFRLEESEPEQAETSDPAGQEDEVELALNGLEMGEEELPAEKLPAEELPVEELPAEELPAQASPVEEPPADEVVIEESVEVVEEEIVEDVEEQVEASTEPPRQVNEQLKNALAPNKQPEQKPVESIPIPKPPPARTPAPPQKPKKVRRAAASVQLTPPDMDKKLAFAEAMRIVRTELLTKMQELRDIEPVHVDDMLRSDAIKQARRIASKLQRVKKLTDAFSPEEIGKAVVQELTGYGPLDELLAQDVERIVINGCYQISVERDGLLEPVEGLFSGENALKSTLGHLVAKAGHQLKDMPATFELRLPDGLWMHVIMSPLSRRGTVVTLRPSRSATWTLEQLLEEEVIDGRIATFLASCVENRRNIVVSGARGSGRSSLLNALGMRIPENERVVSVEEVGELELPHPLWIGLETTSLSPGTYPSDVEELLEHALRTQPSWLLMGDTSGRGLGTLLQRMAAGLEGVMLLGQAHSAGQLLGKLTLLGGFQLDGMLYSQQTQKQFVEGVLAEAVDIVVQTEEFVCGTRKVTGIFELYNGIDSAQLRPLFFFEREGVDEDGVVKGRFKATGEQPAFYDQLEARGVAVERSIFDA